MAPSLNTQNRYETVKKENKYRKQKPIISYFRMPSLAVVFTKSQKVATVSELESSPEERQKKRSERELLVLMRYCKCPRKWWQGRRATSSNGQRICFTSCLGRWCCFYAYFYNQFILITLARPFSGLYTFILISFCEAAGSLWSKVIGLQICLTFSSQLLWNCPRMFVHDAIVLQC